MLTAARFWPQRCNATGSDRNQRKLKVLLPRLADSSEKPSWMIFRQWRAGICCLFFIVLRSCGRKISLNMCHGNSENSNSCTYFLRICSIYGTNLSELRSWKPQQVVDREENAFFIAVQGIFVGIIIKASAASLKVTDLSFYFRVSPRWRFAVC